MVVILQMGDELQGFQARSASLRAGLRRKERFVFLCLL
jgi:hypothetical protein